VKVQKARLLAAALGVVVGGTAMAADKAAPKPMPTAANQKLAEAVADKLTATAAAQGIDRLSVETDGGTVTLNGVCKDADQKAALLAAVRVVPGVKLVKDGLTAGGVAQAQAAAGIPPAAVPPSLVPTGGPAVEPAPLGNGGFGPGDGAAPPLPPYAWPTYAPYNNVSRVGYPTAYPYNAYPFIGPYYPFPKVPLGWRSVSLTWEDGHWWYGRTSAPHDYWRVRFW
jgi:hypothetical protein